MDDDVLELSHVFAIIMIIACIAVARRHPMAPARQSSQSQHLQFHRLMGLPAFTRSCWQSLNSIDAMQPIPISAEPNRDTTKMPTRCLALLDVVIHFMCYLSLVCLGWLLGRQV